MKLKRQTVIEPAFLQSFQKLCQQPLALGDSLRLARAARIIDAENADFNSARLTFFKAHGRAEGETYHLDPAQPEVISAYQAAMNTLLAEEIELPLAQRIKLTPACQLTANELFPLLDLIDSDEPPSVAI